MDLRVAEGGNPLLVFPIPSGRPIQLMNGAMQVLDSKLRLSRIQELLANPLLGNYLEYLRSKAALLIGSNQMWFVYPSLGRA
jgi:hypothetical protein